MSTAPSFEPISVPDYLAGELDSDIRHEYVAGYVYAMAGGTNAHNLIGINCSASLHSQLSGKPCVALSSDTKIRVREGNFFRFYYPDVSVVCDPNPQTDTFQDKPIVLIEVLSESTRRKDETEKRASYCSLPSVQYYVLLEQHAITAVVFRRPETQTTSFADWPRTVLTDIDDVIFFEEIDANLPLRVAYDGVEI